MLILYGLFFIGEDNNGWLRILIVLDKIRGNLMNNNGMVLSGKKIVGCFKLFKFFLIVFCFLLSR